jgi:hypothetical protein
VIAGKKRFLKTTSQPLNERLGNRNTEAHAITLNVIRETRTVLTSLGAGFNGLGYTRVMDRGDLCSPLIGGS